MPERPSTDSSYDDTTPLHNPGVGKEDEFSRRQFGSRRRQPSLIRAPDPVAASYAQSYDSFDEGGEGQEVFVQNFVLYENFGVEFYGYRYSSSKFAVYILLCFLSGGLLYLLCRWFPAIYIYFTSEKCPINESRLIVAKNTMGQFEIINVEFEYFGDNIYNLFQNITPPSLFPWDINQIYSNNSLIDPYLHCFSYRCLRFILNPLTKAFVESSSWKENVPETVEEILRGLDRKRVAEMHAIFGPNVIQIPEKSTFRLLFDEVLHPFFVFQIFSIILWCFEKYFYYAACIFIISVTSSIISLIDSKKNIARLRELSRYECKINVRRDGIWKIVSSEDLVPGDMFELDAENPILPCDSIIVLGDCIINESMLTGESVPVFKAPVTEDELPSAIESPDIDSRSYLFGGTKVIRVRRPINLENPLAQTKALAIAVKTGFNTAKGGLVRSMIFPKPHKFRFYADSFKFLGVLAGIAFIGAMLGFLITLIWFIKNGQPPSLMMLRALDLITIVVPPALPAAMSIGIIFAINRLKLHRIFCISPPRVNICGKLDLFVFDKTGTLTEEGLDIYGVQGVNLVSGRFNDIFSDIHGLLRCHGGNFNIVKALATCHSLSTHDGSLLGDPMDQKMFEFTEWLLEESSQLNDLMPSVVRPPGSRKLSLDVILQKSDYNIELENHDNDQSSHLKIFDNEIGIIRCFEFSSSLRRMSVITKTLQSNSIVAFMKGAPEVVKELCIPDSIPQDFDGVLDSYVRKGFRVLGLAYKEIEGVAWRKLQKMDRNQVETEMVFLGLVIFENKLKRETEGVLRILKRAKIRNVMCTGDNLLTAVSVSKACGLIEQTNDVYAPVFIESDVGYHRTVVWKCLDDENRYLDPRTLLPIDDQFATSQIVSAESSLSPPEKMGEMWKLTRTNSSRDLESNPNGMSRSGDYLSYDLALTGDLYQHILENSSPETVNRILIKSNVFARMAPDQKLDLVDRLKDLDYCVGMCGDGANDCGGLTAADVGISLSEAEASVAAPFTSQLNNIECVLRIIREGRAALVTSFSCFKFIALYSMIQFCSVALMYLECGNLGDFQYLYIDLFLILPIAVLMGRTKSCVKIYPKRPTASLMSKSVLSSMIGQILLCCIFQIVVFFTVVSDKNMKIECKTDGNGIPSEENTVLFNLSCFQYIWTALVFSVGHPYRASMFTNRLFMAVILFSTIMTILLTVSPPAALLRLFELENLSSYRIAYVMIISIINLVFMIVCEKYIFPFLANMVNQLLFVKRSEQFRWSRSFWSKLRNGEWRIIKYRKKFKVIKEEFESDLRR